MKKRIVIALGHRALGTTLPEQKKAVKTSAAVLADMVEEGYQLVITHSNAPQVGMIHTAMNEFGKTHPDYTVAPMSVCSAMSQGYIGYDLQNAVRAELLKRGIFKTVSTILTQVIVDPYDDAFHHPVKVIGRYPDLGIGNRDHFAVLHPVKGAVGKATMSKKSLAKVTAVSLLPRCQRAS